MGVTYGDIDFLSMLKDIPGLFTPILYKNIENIKTSSQKHRNSKTSNQKHRKLKNIENKKHRNLKINVKCNGWNSTQQQCARRVA